MARSFLHVVSSIENSVLVIAHIAIRISAAAILSVIAIGPPVAITWFPQLFEFASIQIYQFGERYWSIAGSVSFLAVVGILGIGPYLFSKAADRILSAIRVIGIEYRAIVQDGWFSASSPNRGLKTIPELIAQRYRGIATATRSAMSLLVSFVILAIAVTWARLLVIPNSVDATLRIDGEVFLETIVEGTEIDINCPSDIPCVFETIVVAPLAREEIEDLAE